MESTTSKHILNIAGVLEVITGSLTLILSIAALALGIGGLTHAQYAQNFLVDIGACTLLGMGAVLGVNAAFSILYGFLEKRAAKNPSKIMPVWYISIISTVFNAIRLIIDIVNQTPLSDMVGSIVFFGIAVLVMIAAGSIKKEAGLTADQT